MQGGNASQEARASSADSCSVDSNDAGAYEHCHGDSQQRGKGGGSGNLLGELVIEPGTCGYGNEHDLQIITDH